MIFAKLEQQKIMWFLDESMQSGSIYKIGWFDVIKRVTPVFFCFLFYEHNVMKMYCGSWSLHA